MMFFKGRAKVLRFAVLGTAPQMFGDEHLDKLREHAVGRQSLPSSDRIATGWAASKSVLDTTFDRDKNILNDTLHFALRVDTEQLPAALRREYYEAALAALLKDDPSGLASAKQKRAAKEAAANRLKTEASDGRFRRRKCTAVLWDRAANEVLLGATTKSLVNQFSELFTRTFGFPLELRASGCNAKQNAVNLKLPAYANASPAFVPGAGGEEADVFVDLGTDTTPLGDASRVTPMPDRKGLSSDCLRAVAGSTTPVSEVPGCPAEHCRELREGSNQESPEPLSLDDADFTLSTGDIFESDCDILRLDDESGSEPVAVETEDDIEGASDQGSDADVCSEPDSREILLLLDDVEESDRAEERLHRNPADAEDVVDLAEMKEDEDTEVLLNMSEAEADADEEQEEVVGIRAEAYRSVPWGIIPSLLLLPSFVLAIVGGLMGVELLQTMWGYQQPRKPAASLVRSVASMLDMELRDQ